MTRAGTFPVCYEHCVVLLTFCVDEALPCTLIFVVCSDKLVVFCCSIHSYMWIQVSLLSVPGLRIDRADR